MVGADPLSDIAVLQLETKDKFTPVAFGDSDEARIGDWVIAIGNPFGLGGTVTSGIISARNRSIGLSRYEKRDLIYSAKKIIISTNTVYY